MGTEDNDDDYDDNDDEKANRAAIPLIAGAILLAQGTMSATTVIGGRLTENGVGRKTLFLVGLITLPIRCALIIHWRDAGSAYLLSTQVLDGIGGGFFSLIHPYLVADITFGSGRFNVISELRMYSIYIIYFVSCISHIFVLQSLFRLSVGLTASCFGLGSTMSNFVGQMVVENLGHVTSLSGSLVLSIVPIVIFSLFMPETLNTRGQDKAHSDGASPTMEYNIIT